MRPAPASRVLPGWVAPLAPAAAATVAVFWNILVHGEVFAARDHAAFYWPVKSIFAALARSSAGLPLWNPLLASGQPFAANPEHAVFHPLTALFLLLPFKSAYVLQVILPFLLSAGSGLFLARVFRLSGAAAALSAVAWAWGGATLSTLHLVPTLLTIAPLPAVLGFAVRLGSRTARSDVLGFGLLYGLMALGGEPPVLMMGTVLAGIALLHGRQLDGPAEADRPSLPVALRRLFAGGLLGVAVGAATLVPGASHALKTVRAAGLGEDVAYTFTTPAVRLAELALGDTWGILTAGGTDGPSTERLYPGKRAPFLISIYPGLLLLAGVAAAWTPRRSPARLWAIPAALGVLLSLGAATPVFPAARHLPLLSGIRFPERFLLMTLAALTVAGTCGLSRLLARNSGGLRSAALGGMLALAVAACIASAGGAPAGALVARVVRQIALLALGLALVTIAARSAAGSALRLLPAFLLAADLASVDQPLVGSCPPAELRALPAPLLPLLESPPRGYVFHAAAHDRLRGERTSIASPPFLAQFGIASALDRDFDMTELVWSANATRTVLQTLSGNLAQADAILARRGIAAVVTFRREAPASPSGAGVRSPEESLALLAVPNPQPLAFAAGRLVLASGATGWRREVTAAAAGARDLAVVDPADARTPLPTVISPARVDVVGREASRLVLRVDAAGPDPSFVALNQTWDSGWEAQLDGRSTPLVRTDLSLSGLLVPAGRHDVVLVYRSVPVAVGAGLSLAALLATGAAFRADRRRPV